MIKVIKVSILAITLLFTNCTSYKQTETIKDGWVYTIATITNSSKMQDNSYGYILTYKVTKSTAYNNAGELIAGDIPHYIMGIKKGVKNGNIKIKYLIDEPMIYELLEQVKYI